jgi:hypothetical protein
MGLEPQIAPVSKKALWVGWIISALPIFALLMSAGMKLMNPPELAEGFSKLGWDHRIALGLGILELVCTLLYVLPRTAILGAVLLTGYLGGASATHVRIGDAPFIQIALGVLVWLGLFLRDARLRILLPLRSDPADPNLGRVGIFKTILLTLLACASVFAIVVALQPAEFRLARSTKIAAPPAEVFVQVNDFRNWEAWSPWTKLDPAAKYTFEGPSAGAGAVITWSGNDEVGEGRMTILESRPDELVKIKLDFIRPFESTCTSQFNFQPEAGQTQVTWSMYGENNYISKAFTIFCNMEKMVGPDFEKGLAQMKAVVESGTKTSQAK